jgi:hypothetical protein
VENQGDPAARLFSARRVIGKTANKIGPFVTVWLIAMLWFLTATAQEAALLQYYLDAGTTAQRLGHLAEAEPVRAVHPPVPLCCVS